MKHFLIFLLMAFSATEIVAQKAPDLFSTLTEKYANKDGFSASKISNDMFDLYLKKNNIEESSPVSEALKNLDNIIVISQSYLNYRLKSGVYSEANKEQTTSDNELHKTILDYYKTSNYTLLKTEKMMGEDVKVYLKKDQGKIKSLALVTNSSVSTAMVELNGNINLKTVADLSDALNLRGLENLHKIDNNNSRFGVYGYRMPNNAGFSTEKIEEMLARSRELYLKQNELSSEQRKKLEEQAHQLAEKQAVMAEKYREMAEKYHRNPIFLSYPGDTNTVYYLDGKRVKSKLIKELDKDKIEKVEVEKANNKKDKTTIRISTK